MAFGYARPAAGLPIAALCAGLVLTLRRGAPYGAAVGLAFLAFSLGAFDARARLARADVTARAAAGAPRCAFRLVALEAEGGLGTLASVGRSRCFGVELPAGGLVWVERGQPRAVLEGEGWLVPLGDGDFDVARRRFGAGAEAVFTQVRTTPPRGGIAAVVHDIRTGLADATRDMPRERAGLLRGLTTGDTALLDDDVVDEFRAAGLSHLVAVSGQNVAMVLGAVALATHALGARIRLGLSAGALALFVLVVGPQPSVLRAAAMAAIALTGLGLGVRAEPWRLLAAALVVVVAFRPAVLYSAGLHLSVAATAGLLLWARPIMSGLPRLPRWLALALGATLAAQFAVTPLVAGLFGSVSLAAPIANVLALPAVPGATLVGLCAAVIGALSPGAGRTVAGLAEPFVAWILWVADSFGGTSWAAVAVPAWSAWPLGALVLGSAVWTVVRSRAATLGSNR